MSLIFVDEPVPKVCIWNAYKMNPSADTWDRQQTKFQAFWSSCLWFVKVNIQEFSSNIGLNKQTSVEEGTSEHRQQLIICVIAVRYMHSLTAKIVNWDS